MKNPGWCMQPNPVTTVGEGLTMRELAEEGWITVTAVTNRPQTRRTRSTFEECTDLNVTVAPVDYVNMTRMIYHVAREIGSYIKFWLTNPC